MTNRQYLVQFVMIFLGSCIFIVWALVNTYLDKRDRKRKQSHR